MIVVDASVVVDYLLGAGSKAGDELAGALAEGTVLLAPHLVDVEVGQVLRRFVLRGVLGHEHATGLVDELTALPIRRQPHVPLLGRAFELRENVTMYDALYLALAEATDLPLWTGDAALSGVPGVDVGVRVLATGEAAPS